MSTIATTLAAAVAQTAHNAEKIARQHDKRRLDRDTDRAEFSQLIAERLEGLDDANETDDQLPDRQAPGYESLYPRPPHTQAPASPTADAPVASFQHIDLQA